MSFTATISMSVVPAARWASTARQKLRPMRPNPFTPTRTVMCASCTALACLEPGTTLVAGHGTDTPRPFIDSANLRPARDELPLADRDRRDRDQVATHQSFQGSDL